MEKEDARIAALVAHLDARQKERATESLERILATLTEFQHRYGNPFDLDLRFIAANSGLNLKRVHKWIKRMTEIGVLEIIRKGSYKGLATSYILHGSARGTHQSISKKSATSTLLEFDYLKQETIQNESLSERFRKSNSSNVVAPLQQSLSSCSYSSFEFANKRCVPLADLEDVDAGNISDIATSDYLLEVLRNVKPVKRSRLNTKRNAYRGQLFVQELWAQCQNEKHNGGRYPYPIHPEVYWLLTHNAPDSEYEIFFGADGKLLPKYRWLWQPPKETRKKCPRCEREGKRRTLRLVMLTEYRFGAIRYQCDACHLLWDLWKEHPVW